MYITTVGLDLAKNVFHIVGLDEKGREKMKKRLSRGQVMKYFGNAPRCLVGMEACASAHHFARELAKLGHEVNLIAPQYVKAYVRGQKNGTNDARAIAEAVRAPQMRFVAVKTVKQQDLRALARLREGVIRTRTSVVNRVRGLLVEYGIVVKQGVNALRRALPEILEDGSNGLSDRFRRLLAQGCEQLAELDAHIKVLTTEFQAAAKEDERVRRLQTIPGFGPIVAGVFGLSPISPRALGSRNLPTAMTAP